MGCIGVKVCVYTRPGPSETITERHGVIHCVNRVAGNDLVSVPPPHHNVTRVLGRVWCVWVSSLH